MEEPIVERVNALLNGKVRLLPGPSHGCAWSRPHTGALDIVFEANLVFAYAVPSGPITAESIATLIQERMAKVEEVLKEHCKP